VGKKELRFLFVLVLVLVAFAFISENNFGSNDLHEPLESQAKGYEIEDISAEILSDGAVIFVSGKIRNLGAKPIRGDVVIYMVDGADGVVHLVETEVKGYIQFEGVGLFEAYQSVEGFELDSIASIFIDFIEQ